MDDLGLALDLHHSSEQMETRRAEQFMRHRRRKSAFLTEPDRPKPVVGETAFLFAEFVSMREHAPLEELRLELLEMVEEVKKKQVDVISVEYAEFVGIADGLKGLDRELEDLGPSLLEMQRDVQDMLAAAQVSVQEMQQSIHVEQLGLAAQIQQQQDNELAHIVDTLNILVQNKQSDKELAMYRKQQLVHQGKAIAALGVDAALHQKFQALLKAHTL